MLDIKEPHALNINQIRLKPLIYQQVVGAEFIVDQPVFCPWSYSVCKLIQFIQQLLFISVNEVDILHCVS
ncbi:hypothetical protein D3C81_2038570 [compost metagenome]